MKEFWNQRYSSEAYAYGKEPNAFFLDRLETTSPGKLLLPGEGEGRNATYAAAKGWAVDAFDLSSAGQKKALALASERGVEINYRVCSLEDYSFKENQYDAVALIYFHTESSGRKYLHRKVFESLKPGGSLFLEAFHKEQLNNTTGGPKSPDMLYDEDILKDDFALFDTRLLEKQQIILKEGPFHQGKASVIRFHGIKVK